MGLGSCCIGGQGTIREETLVVKPVSLLPASFSTHGDHVNIILL